MSSSSSSSPVPSIEELREALPSLATLLVGLPYSDSPQRATLPEEAFWACLERDLALDAGASTGRTAFALSYSSNIDWVLQMGPREELIGTGKIGGRVWQRAGRASALSAFCEDLAAKKIEVVGASEGIIARIDDALCAWDDQFRMTFCLCWDGDVWSCDFTPGRGHPKAREYGLWEGISESLEKAMTRALARTRQGIADFHRGP
jgi:hypothetical protein